MRFGGFGSPRGFRRSFLTLCLLLALICFEELNFSLLRTVYRNLYSDTVYRPIRSIRSDQNLSIAILTIVKDADVLDYSLALNSVKCYALHHGYRNLVIDVAADETLLGRCSHSDFMFQRHCVAARIGERHPELQWLLFIDADMGVVNPDHLLEEFLPESPTEIVFYERIFNHEIMAGSYLFRNSNYSQRFLDFWADYQFSLPSSFHGTDNGAIHNVFLERLRPDLDTRCCQRLWSASRDYEGLADYTVCTRWLMGQQADFDGGRVRLLRKEQREQRWSRDGWLTNSLWSGRDFVLHGWQLRKRDWTRFASWPSPFASSAFDEELCATPRAHLNWPYKDSFVRADAEIEMWLAETIAELRSDFLTRLRRVFHA